MAEDNLEVKEGVQVAPSEGGEAVAPEAAPAEVVAPEAAPSLE